METIRDITALEELPEAAATGLANANRNRNRNRNQNTQGRNSTNCQGQGTPTCVNTCGFTTLDLSTNWGCEQDGLPIPAARDVSPLREEVTTMETIRDITALEELPEAAATGLANANRNRNRNRNQNTQGRNSTNCQGQGGATCLTTCGFTTVDASTN